MPKTLCRTSQLHRRGRASAALAALTVSFRPARSRIHSIYLFSYLNLQQTLATDIVPSLILDISNSPYIILQTTATRDLLLKPFWIHAPRIWKVQSTVQAHTSPIIYLPDPSNPPYCDPPPTVHFTHNPSAGARQALETIRLGKQPLNLEGD
ncbi:hypothetical protein M430DRAFT_21131 [Amorphotheca resinae ATCC 22711]|uniref:Uncharacterized protein n=1 Tax=Amorphotheca resinae ATCC 22711 TaxID=857342 RepID=A0A2T3AX33_AMORE|nr:hypothetical protein M430DRAFT_21131 [Amorphotheca resinae ATCC 22711]PSS13221.1 hypothetical protein M430DRAFT_21131 [Amorphotheca resinae ATCC 22711]